MRKFGGAPGWRIIGTACVAPLVEAARSSRQNAKMPTKKKAAPRKKTAAPKSKGGGRWVWVADPPKLKTNPMFDVTVSLIDVEPKIWRGFLMG
jgi:hypothetical protein